MSREKFKELPLIYSCSGCSNIAQLANQVAVELDREHIAEMSCIAGIGGGVASILKKAKCGRNIIALDGCYLHCVKNSFLQHNINPNYHYTLTEYGIKKRYHKNFLPSDVNKIKTIVKTDLSLIREG